MANQFRSQPSLTERINYSSGFLDDKKLRNRIAITGLVFALVGLLFVVPMFGFLVFPFLALGLVCAIVAFRRTRKGARFAGLAIATIIITSLTLIAGIVTNILTYRHAQELWAYCPTPAVAPSGPQADALVGDWALASESLNLWQAADANIEADQPFIRFNPNGVGENLNDGECFNWDGDGSFENANMMRSWHLDGDTVEIESIIGTTMVLNRIN